jgi:senataxin
MASKLAGEEVEAVLRKRQGASSRPGQEDLLIPYEYIRGTFRSSRNEGSSASATASPHWYCSKCSESLHREVATYLIFLFAYAKSENAQLWLTELEAVLECEGCARGFGVAKRRFRRK